MSLGVQLLGSPSIDTDGTPLVLPMGKTSALLYYLAYERTWVTRPDLLLLLWPDREERKARSNLRQRLTEIRRREGIERVEIERSRLRWLVDTDLHAFTAAVLEGRLEDAVASYAGPLLEGFYVDDVPEFESWLELEREQLHRQWRNVVLQYVEKLTREHRLGEAAALLERVTTEDPLDEEAWRALLRTLARSGRRAEALARFEAFREHLERELGVEPDEETQALVQIVRETSPAQIGSVLAASAPGIGEGMDDAWSHVATGIETHRSLQEIQKLPASPNPFVGRRAERSVVEARLAEPGVSLLSLVAPGGMGKTHFAMEVARNVQHRYRDGAAFVPFVNVERPEQMEGVLADAIGLEFSGNLPPRRQLLLHLESREMLLVLDNLEQLRDDLSLLNDLVAHCPGIDLIATSRERLGLTSEWIHDLYGLDYPEPGEDPLTTDAVALFLRAGERVRSGFADVEGALGQIAELCRLVRGMPLALVLAASWLRALTLPDMVAEVSTGFDLLGSDARDLPERHRSIHAVFDRTWKELRHVERNAWSALSLFEGGFEREAAEAVAGVRLPLLLALSNRALLHRDADGRFDLHPLVMRYGRDRAAELPEREAIAARHAEHYTRLVARLWPELFRSGQQRALSILDREVFNVQRAWRTACDSDRFDLVADAAFALWDYDTIRAAFDRRARTFTHAAAALTRTPAAPHRDRALARCLLLVSGDAGFGDRRTRTRRSRELAREIGDKACEARACIALGEFDAARALWAGIGDEAGMAIADLEAGTRDVLEGRYDDAQLRLERALDTFVRLGDPRLEWEALDWLATRSALTGDVERAVEIAYRVQAINEGYGFEGAQINTLGTLHWIEICRGEFDAARRYLAEWIAKSAASEANGLLLRTSLEVVAGAYEAALDYGARALALLPPRGERGGILIALVLNCLGRAALRTGRTGLAESYVVEGAEVALGVGAPRLIGDAAAAAGELLVHRGDGRLGGELLATALADPATGHNARQQIEAGRAYGLADLADVRPRDRAWMVATLAELFDIDVGS